MGKNKKEKEKGKEKKKNSKYPFVSICTPTFNRRPFVPMMLKCFEHQTYPKDRIEWIIIDDGTDKIEDLVTHIPQVKYFKFDTKLTLGKKRNLSNEKAIGEIIVYMDDDDYYPPDRVSHAVETLIKHPNALCAGSSAMLIFFKHINKMYQFGPYGPNHSTAATFAFKRELLKRTTFNEDAAVAEEKFFLKDYTIPFVQLDSNKSIIVFSHIHNSFDKKELLNQLPNPLVKEVEIKPSDLIKEPEVLKFFMEDIDIILDAYEPGELKYKPDVTKELNIIKERREKMKKEHMEKQQIQQIQQNCMHPQVLQQKFNEQSYVIHQLSLENKQLQEKIKYLEDTISKMILSKIQQRKEPKNNETSYSEKRIDLSQTQPVISNTI
jgi:glycosyltransferase involved in cell wall biosynthesis